MMKPPGTMFAHWPKNADQDYRAARQALLEAEIALRDQREHVARLRRSLPTGAAVEDYAFEEGPANLSDESDVPHETRLSDLVGVERPLVLYNLMSGPMPDGCPMCSMWIDGLQGVLPHLQQRMTFAVVCNAPLDQLRAWGRQRGWKRLRLLSSVRTSFVKDMQLGEPGDTFPGLISFVSDADGTLRHWMSSYAESGLQNPPDQNGRMIDLYCPTWHLLDLLPRGRQDWFPANDYAVAAAHNGPGR
jgi:predicted dithiol-disulfide oxidoreductase (DUF899 family)